MQTSDENCKVSLEMEFLECLKDVLDNESVCEMHRYVHHGNYTCFEHSLNVAYYTYLWCKKMNLDYKEAARGAMLHDLFLYDWHTHAKLTGKHFHGLTHPAVAEENASKIFFLSEKERDMIRKHMWPLTIIPPKYAESYVLMLVDKYCSITEVIAAWRNREKASHIRLHEKM